jgi:hypothetical protein
MELFPDLMIKSMVKIQDLIDRSYHCKVVMMF